MQSFDHIAEARLIQDDLASEFPLWKLRIDDAIESGSAGTEILMAVRWNLMELLKTNPTLSEKTLAHINGYIDAANKLLA
jgi:hypothetical protein